MFGHPVVQVGLSILAVLILLLSSADLPSLHLPQNGVTTDLSGITPVKSPYYPFLSSTSSFPSPDILPNESGAIALPQLATQVVDSLPVYEMAFVNTIPGVGTILEAQSGEYNASIAQNIFTTGFCKTHCNSHLPILWNSPVPIAAYGGNTVQGDAIGATGSWLFVAAAANNITSLYFSPNYGTNGSWYTLTGNHPVSGSDPRLAVSSCNALLTTLTSTNLIATRFSLPCGKAWGPPPPPPTPSPPSGGGHPPSGGPTVSILLPSQSANLSTIQVNGTGYSGTPQVLFGNVPSSHVVVLTSTALTAKVPSGWGILPVQVITSGGGSPPTCADLFSHGATLTAHTPEVSSVVPTAAPVGSTVLIYGAYFQAASTVKFGSTAGTGVTLVSPGVLQATVPLGTGTVNVTVTNTVGTSPTAGCADLFTIQAIPSVVSVTPDQGPVGQSTTVLGRNFLSTAAVYFGATISASVTVLNSTLISATAPSGGSGTVNVTVRQSGYTSSISCADNFTYGAAPPSTAPQVEWLTPWANASFGSVVIYGYNFQSNATAYFGGVPTPRVYYVSSGALQVEVPLGTGTVPIQVSESGGNSLTTCADRFTIQWPAPLGNFTTKTWTLPKSLDADPTFIGGNPYTGLNALGAGITAGILASNATDSKIVLYRLNATTQLFIPTKIVSFASFNASSPVNSIGQTSLSVSNGTSGQVATVSVGQAVFGLFTTFLNGEFVAESLGSADGGKTWGGPYAAPASVGSVRDPEATVSPAGYVYVTWRDNAAGPWEVDQSVYWPSGLSLVPSAPISGSGGGTLAPAGPPTVLVDPFGRPLYAWSTSLLWGGGTPPAGPVPTGGWSTIGYSGAFASAYSVLRSIGTGFNATVPADYENFGGPGLHSFRASVNVTLQKLQNDTTNASKLCLSQKVSYGSLYPNVTQTDPPPVVLGRPLPSCTLFEGLDNSIIVASTGPFAANTYLEVLTSNLLEALGVGSMPVPAWFAALFSPPPPRGGSFVPGAGATWTNGQGTAIQVTPLTLNPGSVFLNATGVFWTKTGATNNTHSGIVCGVTSNVDLPTLYSTNLTIKNQAGTTTAVYTYASSSQLSDVYVTYLRGERNGTWSERISVTYRYTQQSTNYCTSSYGFTNYTHPVSPPVGWPKNFTVTLAGTYTTGLGYYPSNVTLNSTGVNGNSGIMNDTAAWQNTVFAIAKAWLNQTSGGTHYNAVWSNGTYQVPEYLRGSGFQSIPVGRSYSYTSLIQTTLGSVNSSWWPVMNGNQVSTAPPIETLKYVCPGGFTQLANFQRLWWYGTGVTQNISNVSADSATVTWFSNGNNSGWVEYTQATGIDLNQSAQVIKVNAGNGTYYEYVAELHGLQPWGVYYATAHVRMFSSCVEYQNQTTKWRFQTQAALPLTEQDLPYDSISQAGGGAQLFFQVPTPFTQLSTFNNGSLTFSNASATTVEPLNFLPPAVSVQGLGSINGWNFNTTYQLNITGLGLNSTYNASLTLNYTTVGNQLFTAVSQPFSFVYGKDTSGDGLTDAEKSRGWNVTTERLVGTTSVYSVAHAQPNPALYATNGLVSDYVEKEFGLSPTTVDSAGSHMLDTWNLTFDLGSVSNPSSPPPSAKLQYWNENGSYNPFNVCLFPGDPQCHSHTVALDRSNLSDGTPYDSEVLWSTSALTKLVGLSGVKAAPWLRAVYGSYTSGYGTNRTLTVSGKLSWGANPLAASTPSDGVADGARVNPLYDEDIQLNFLAVAVNPNGTNNGCGNLPSGAGWALRFSIPGAPGGFQGYNYSTQSNTCPGGAFGYTLTTPVANTQQSQTVSLQFWANNSTGSTPLPEQLPINGCHSTYNVSVGMLNGTSQTILLYGNPGQTCSGAHNVQTLARFSYTEMPAGIKNRTWLWVPNDNSSLSPLPWGLKRYVAEQAFDLIVVNDTHPDYGGISSASVPFPWGGTGPAITIYPGLNSFLIPRVQFLNSSLGEAILEGKKLPNAVRIFGPLLSGSQGGAVVNSSSAGSLADLACYWQNIAVYAGPALCSRGQTGTPNSSWDRVLVDAATSCGGSNCGGLPSNPKLETSAMEGAAIQTVITFNLTDNGSLGSSRLDALLAGLIDNMTGGVNGTLQSITTEAETLGFVQPVLIALPNNALPNGGLHGAPVSHATSQPPPTILGSLWNLVSGVGTSIAGTVFGAVWTLAFAAWQYFVGLASALISLGGQALARTVQALTAAGGLVLSALAAAMTWIIGLVKGMLVAAFQWIVQAVTATTAAIKAAFLHAADDVVGLYDSLLGVSSAGTAISNYIVPFLLMAIGIPIALDIIFGLTLPLSLGVGLVIGLLFPVLLQLAGSLLQESQPSASQSNSATTFASSVNPSSGVSMFEQSANLFNATTGDNSSILVPAVKYSSNGTLGNVSGQGQPVGDAWSIMGLAVAWNGAVLVGGAAEQFGEGDLAAQYAALFGGAAFFMAMIAAIIALQSPLTCAANPVGWTSLFFAAIAVFGISMGALGLGLYGLLRGATPNLRAIGGMGFVFGGASAFFAAETLNSLYGSRCTWMP